MSNHKLFIDRRVAVSGAKSKILMDNPVAIHAFISNYIANNPTIVTSIMEALPEYANDAAAGVGGITTGQLYKNSTDNTISYKS